MKSKFPKIYGAGFNIGHRRFAICYWGGLVEINLGGWWFKYIKIHPLSKSFHERH